MEFQRNMFCDPSAAGLVKIELEDGSSFVWNEGSRVTDHADLRIANASKAKHFLDYKGLLRTYFLQGQRVNVFDLLLEDILADVVNDLSGLTFAEGVVYSPALKGLEGPEVWLEATFYDSNTKAAEE